MSERADECPHCGAPTSLSVKEKVVGTFRPTILAQDTKRVALWSLFGICTCGLGFLGLVPWWIELRYTVLEVTNRRVTLTRGFWNRSSTEVLLDHIRNVTVTQRVAQRALDAGDVGISSSGQADVELMVPGLANPKHLKTLIDSYRNDD